MAARRSRATTVALWVVQVLLAVWFLISALGKLGGEPGIVATFAALGPAAWLRYPVAVLEILGAVALLVPATMAAAAVAFVLLMVGAVLVQVVAVGGGVLTPLVTLVLCLLLVAGRWPEVRSTAARVPVG